MKKYSLIVFCLIISVILSACKTVQNSPIKYERKLEKYFEHENRGPNNNVIDLSEGPKLKYNANFGPKDLNFDFKIVNPY